MFVWHQPPPLHMKICLFTGQGKRSFVPDSCSSLYLMYKGIWILALLAIGTPNVVVSIQITIVLSRTIWKFKESRMARLYRSNTKNSENPDIPELITIFGICNSFFCFVCGYMPRKKMHLNSLVSVNVVPWLSSLLFWCVLSFRFFFSSVHSNFFCCCCCYNNRSFAHHYHHHYSLFGCCSELHNKLSDKLYMYTHTYAGIYWDIFINNNNNHITWYIYIYILYYILHTCT